MKTRQKTKHVRKVSSIKKGGGRVTPSIIRSKTLELIALTMSTADTAAGLKNLLLSCGVELTLIDQKQPVLQMVSDVLFALATSKDPQDHDTLYRIIREATHPVMFDGDEAKTMETVDALNAYLQHDGFWLEDGYLFKRLGAFPNGDEVWSDTAGSSAEPKAHKIVEEAPIFKFDPKTGKADYAGFIISFPVTSMQYVFLKLLHSDTGRIFTYDEITTVLHPKYTGEVSVPMKMSINRLAQDIKDKVKTKAKITHDLMIFESNGGYRLNPEPMRLK